MSISSCDKENFHDVRKTLLDVLNFAALKFSEQCIAHVSSQDGSEDIQTYGSLAKEARNFAELILSKGWKSGDRIIFVISDSRLFATSFWGCLLAGIVPVPLSPLASRDPDSMEAEKIRNVISITNASILTDSRIGTHVNLLVGITENACVPLIYADEIIRESSLGHFDAPVLPKIDEGDLAVLQFSSGSSGLPKGVCLTHRNIIANIEGQIDSLGIEKSDILCTWLPYFHDFGLFWAHILPIYLGIKQVHIDPGHFARSPMIWLEKLAFHRATITNSIPTALHHLLDYIELKQKKKAIPFIDLSALKSMIVGAEMIDPHDCRRAIKLLSPFGIKDTLIQGGYGLTETTVAAAACRPGTKLKTRILDRTQLVEEGKVIDFSSDHPQAAEFVSVGQSIKNCEIRVVDKQGNPVSADQVGIVEIRGASVTSGYFNNPEATQIAFRHDDWFDSGDIGFLDADGFLTITGRAKEMIIVGGRNYYPWDLEQIALRASGAVETLRHVTICGFWNPDMHREEIALFFVAKRVSEDEITTTLKNILQHVNSLAGFSIDSFIRMKMSNIPRTSSGKVMRRVLIEKLLDGTHQRISEISDSKTPVLPRKRRTPDEIRGIIFPLWSETLGISINEINVEANLFGLGCNSLRASHIQGRLEDIIGQRLPTNFNYVYPNLEDQISYLIAVDPSVEAPCDEIELILRTVVHDILELPEHEISVIQSLSPLMKGLSTANLLLSEIRYVFDLEDGDVQNLEGDTIRALAREIRKLTGIGSNQGRLRFPLMNFQETLYFHRKGFVRNEPSNLSCFIFIALDLETKNGNSIDPVLLSIAFDRVIQRHPMMRSIIDDLGEHPQLRILDKVRPFEVKFSDLSG